MVQPMIYDELHCLEKEIFQRKAAKIFVFKRTIVDGYEAYEIASRLNLPIKRISISVDNYNEAVIWICRTQLKRSDLTLNMRKYLIGRRSLAEQACKKDALNISSKKFNSRMECIATFTRMKIGEEYKYCYSSVRDYEACAKTVDKVFSFNSELAEMLLRGKKQVLQKDLIAFSKLSESQLKNKMKFYLSDKYGCDERLTVKNTPIYDPDAEISSLSLTIPSWVNLIEKVQKNLTPQITEKAADEIFGLLNVLKDTAENFLNHIVEVL